MYSVIDSVDVRQGLAREAPPLILSLGIAEAFYKFGSFTLEGLAFLATWFVASYALARARALLAGQSVGP